MSHRSLLAFCVFFLVIAPGMAQSGGQLGQPGGSRSAGDRTIVIDGRLVSEGTTRLHYPIAVRLEGSTYQLFNTAFTDAEGRFSFAVPRGPGYYLSVDAEGFVPLRQALDSVPPAGPRMSVTIFLRPETVVRAETRVARTADDPNIVDVRQLGANVPQGARTGYRKGLEATRAGEFEDAVRSLEEAVRLAPDFYEAHNALGVARLRLGHWADAESAFGRARALSPGATEPLVNLGRLYLQEGEAEGAAGGEPEASRLFEDAVAILEEAVGHNASSASAGYYLGAALFKTGNYVRSEAMLLRALDLDAELHNARLVLGQIYMDQDRFDEAYDQLSAYLQANAQSPLRTTIEAMQRELEQMRSGR